MKTLSTQSQNHPFFQQQQKQKISSQGLSASVSRSYQLQQSANQQAPGVQPSFVKGIGSVSLKSSCESTPLGSSRANGFSNYQLFTGNRADFLFKSNNYNSQPLTNHRQSDQIQNPFRSHTPSISNQGSQGAESEQLYHFYHQKEGNKRHNEQYQSNEYGSQSQLSSSFASLSFKQQQNSIEYKRAIPNVQKNTDSLLPQKVIASSNISQKGQKDGIKQSENSFESQGGNRKQEVMSKNYLRTIVKYSNSTSGNLTKQTIHARESEYQSNLGTRQQQCFTSTQNYQWEKPQSNQQSQFKEGLLEKNQQILKSSKFLRKDSTPQILSPKENVIEEQKNQIGVKQKVAEYLDLNLIPKIEKSKISQRPIGNILSYAANTHSGLVRNYNEDRVSIIMNIMRPEEKSSVQNWPSVSFFAIYDGHGGSSCPDFLRDYLHLFIIKDEEFPNNPEIAIKNGFKKAESEFLFKADSLNPIDKSGSCAIVVMFIDKLVYIANLGDSRAVLSSDQGKNVVGLTVDHKPNLPSEEKRILENGGKIYQSSIPSLHSNSIPQFIKGPHRVQPGRLAVSRTIGDIEAKLKKYGGNSKVVSSEPEISCFSLKKEHDFIMLGCDGIFDKLTNEQSMQYLWESLYDTSRNQRSSNLHESIGKSVENLMRGSFIHKSYDNLTVVLICLKSLDDLIS